MRKRNIVICDLDGTLADDEDRAVRHLRGEKKNWEPYFAECMLDKPHMAAIEVVKAMFTAGYMIYILTGRSNSTNGQTVTWLTAHGVPWHVLQMRNVNDRTQDDVLKIGWANDLFKIKDETLLVLEDRRRVVEAWRKAGYVVFQVADANF